MPILPCTSAKTGSASPAITVEFKDTCGNPVAVDGLQAKITDRYGNTITTVTYGTFTPAEAADKWSTTISLSGTVFEIQNLPILDTSVIPDGIVNVQWTTTENVAQKVIWKMYGLAPPAGVAPKNTIITWPPFESAVGYRVSYTQGTDETTVLGYTTLPSFVDTVQKDTNLTFRLPDDAAGSWDLSIKTASGALGTTLVSSTVAADPVYILADDGSIWDLVVESATGNLITTLNTDTTPPTTSSIILRGPDGTVWSVNSLATGNLDTRLAYGQASLSDCSVKYCIEALGPCYQELDSSYEVIKTYGTKEYSTSITEKDVCVITGQVLTVSGYSTKVDKVLFSIYAFDDAQTVQNSVLLSRDVDCPVDARGNFSIPIIQGALVTCEIPRAGYAKRFIVPAQPQVDLSQITGIDVEMRRGE